MKPTDKPTLLPCPVLTDGIGACSLHVVKLCGQCPNRTPAHSPAVQTDRDFPQDFAGENGNYEHRCLQCGETFHGHKRRVVCWHCERVNKFAMPKHSPAVRALVEAAKRMRDSLLRHGLPYPDATDSAIEQVARDAAEIKSNWLPIDTAPKDGSVIIGWHPRWGEPMTVDWDRTLKTWMGSSLQPTFQPTQWMPLPEPPKAIAAVQREQEEGT